MVIVHEIRDKFLITPTEMGYDVYLRNHGVGTAYNVRFGVLLKGASYPFVSSRTEDRGARQLVETGERVPASGELTIPASWASFIREGADVDRDRVYWARYENGIRGDVGDAQPRQPGDGLSDRAPPPEEAEAP